MMEIAHKNGKQRSNRYNHAITTQKQKNWEKRTGESCFRRFQIFWRLSVGPTFAVRCTSFLVNTVGLIWTNYERRDRGREDSNAVDNGTKSWHGKNTVKDNNTATTNDFTSQHHLNKQETVSYTSWLYLFSVP